MMTPEDIHKMVETEPTIWSGMAQERRFAAYVVSHLKVEQIKDLAQVAGFRSSEPKWSLDLSFYREAGQALELILKAVLAKQVRTKKRKKMIFSHDLIELWSEAGLADLDPEDMKRLRLFSRAVFWFGRYPTAKNSKVAQSENAALLNPPEDVSSLDWDDFDRFFNRVNEHFRSMPV